MAGRSIRISTRGQIQQFTREWVVKRVVGLPAEEVEVRNGNLLINGMRLSEKHPIEPGRLLVEKGTLLPEKFALLGDNRSVSPAQIVHAVVPRDSIFGRVAGSFRLWPTRREPSGALDGS